MGIVCSIPLRAAARVLFWYHARFSASTDHPTSQGATGCSKRFFDVAHDNGADLVVEGHSHLYERYDTRDKSGLEVAGGITSIVCGTGGARFDFLQVLPSPTPDVAFTNAWGLCKLTLNPNNAQVDFVAAPALRAWTALRWRLARDASFKA